MSKLKIVYSQEYEVNRIKDTIRQIDWFIANKYDYKKFPFPKALDVNKLKDYSEEEISNAVKEEYLDDLYKQNEMFLLDHWSRVLGEVEAAFVKSSLQLQNEYVIYLTRYGTSGSYSLPSKVIANIQSYYNIGLFKVIIHEIIHLSIQKYIDEYKIEQWPKERMVDLFFNKNFPKWAQIKKLPINTEKIDKIFDENFPDMKKVIEGVSGCQ